MASLDLGGDGIEFGQNICQGHGQSRRNVSVTLLHHREQLRLARHSWSGMVSRGLVKGVHLVSPGLFISE